jgi:predicted adenylyl cyclase CyaB
MIELELKSVVPDLDALRQALLRGGASLVFEGELEDRRYDTPDRDLGLVDHVLRLRTHRDADGGQSRASLEWKGPTSLGTGYKQREELGSEISDATTMATILGKLGFIVTMAIDRRIWQFDVDGATVRLERYPRMDDLVEVEGGAATIEHAIARTGLPRAGFTSDRLRDFVLRFEARTGARAALSQAALAGAAEHDTDNA